MAIIDVLGMGPKRTETQQLDGAWIVEVTVPTWVNPEATPARVYLTAIEYRSYREWRDKGGLIQEHLPKLSASQREMLMTGYSDEDFHKFTRDIDDE